MTHRTVEGSPEPTKRITPDAPASPAQPQGERELPPLPRPEWVFDDDPDWPDGYQGCLLYTRKDMRDYARASLSASTPPAAATWTAHEDCGMRHPEACDLMGGETDATSPAVSAEARDAARYRWLRSRRGPDHINVSDGNNPLYMGRMDRAVDAAMGTPPADNKENGNG